MAPAFVPTAPRSDRLAAAAGAATLATPGPKRELGGFSLWLSYIILLYNIYYILYIM